MKTPEQAAKDWCDNFYPDSKMWRSEDGNAYQGFLAGDANGSTREKARAEKLVEAVSKWLTSVDEVGDVFANQNYCDEIKAKFQAYREGNKND